MFTSGQVAQNLAVGSVGHIANSTNQLAEVCIIGDGTEGLTLANLVNANKVVIYADGAVSPYPNLEQLQIREYEIRERGAAVSSQRGYTRIDVKNVDKVDELRNSEGLVISGSTTRYGAIIEKLASTFRDGLTVCLINAPLGAGLEFKALLGKHKVKRQINIIEAGRLFDSARVESGVLLVSGLRSKVSVSGLERNETRRGLAVASAVVRGIVPFSSVIERGLSDAERIIRPALLLSALIADDMSVSINSANIKILRALDREVQGLAKAFQCVVPEFLKSLQDFTFSDNSAGRHKSVSLDCALSALGSGLLGQCENSPKAFSSLLSEDVCQSLTLLADMGVLSRSPVNVISSIVEMASVLLEDDLNKKGRKLSSLGLIGFDTTEIVDLVNA